MPAVRETERKRITKKERRERREKKRKRKTYKQKSTHTKENIVVTTARSKTHATRIVK